LPSIGLASQGDRYPRERPDLHPFVSPVDLWLRGRRSRDVDGAAIGTYEPVRLIAKGEREHVLEHLLPRIFDRRQQLRFRPRRIRRRRLSLHMERLRAGSGAVGAVGGSPVVQGPRDNRLSVVRLVIRLAGSGAADLKFFVGMPKEGFGA
jgi:hypothetical protein